MPFFRSLRIDAVTSPFSDYIVYVDESGDHSLESINPEYPLFVLSFCIFLKNAIFEYGQASPAQAAAAAAPGTEEGGFAACKPRRTGRLATARGEVLVVLDGARPRSPPHPQPIESNAPTTAPPSAAHALQLPATGA